MANGTDSGGGARSIKLIANPTAGRAGDRKLDSVVGYLRENGACVELTKTRKRGDALEEARSTVGSGAGPDIVVAAGGDGTINEVVNGLVGTEVPLGVIPLGTVNLYALETGIPMDIKGACDVLLDGNVMRVRLGRVNDRYFLLMAGVGFDADVVYRLDLALKRRLGKLAYVLTGVSRLASYRYGGLSIELDDGRTIEGRSVVVGNMKYYGGRMSVTPFADFRKDSLDVCVFKGGGAFNMLRYAWGIMKRRHLSYGDVEYATAKSLRVSSDRKIYIQIDGDFYGTLPAAFTKTDESLSVVLPGEAKR